MKKRKLRWEIRLLNELKKVAPEPYFPRTLLRKGEKIILAIKDAMVVPYIGANNRYLRLNVTTSEWCEVMGYCMDKRLEILIYKDKIIIPANGTGHITENAIIFTGKSRYKKLFSFIKNEMKKSCYWNFEILADDIDIMDID